MRAIFATRVQAKRALCARNDAKNDISNGWVIAEAVEKLKVTISLTSSESVL